LLQSRPKNENSNRYSSTPEVDFFKIPTAFNNVQGALKMTLEIFRQEALQGVELEKGASVQKFQTPFSQNFMTRFSLNLQMC